MTDNTAYVTKEGLAKLTQELADLKKARKEIAIRIQDAKELGDLSENAEYSEAKNAQAFNEGRIIDIENILKNAEVIDNGGSVSGEARVGSKVRVQTAGQEKVFSIVGSNEASPSAGFISNESPLGQALIGKKVGDTASVQVPKGKIIYKIIKVE
ncbi:TPA: transcription elongation factor GreA [Patescibacteria group bacterium]|nr:transcription elongation factor GreA [Patescibacteria group bacterium]HCU47713.1 transcription elongation factor GreA [Patescibacteria group bacterium]